MEWILRNWILLFAWCNEVVKWKRESGKIHWMITFILRNIVCHLYISLQSCFISVLLTEEVNFTWSTLNDFWRAKFCTMFSFIMKEGLRDLDYITAASKTLLILWKHSGMMVGMSLCYKHSSIPFLLSSLRLLSKTLIAIFDFCWALQTDI